MVPVWILDDASVKDLIKQVVAFKVLTLQRVRKTSFFLWFGFGQIAELVKVPLPLSHPRIVPPNARQTAA